MSTNDEDHYRPDSGVWPDVLSQLRAEQEAHEIDLKKLEDERIAHEADLEELRREREAHKADVESLEAELRKSKSVSGNELTELLAALEREKAEHRADLDALEQEKTEHKVDLEALEQEKAEHQADLERQTSVIEHFKGELERTKSIQLIQSDTIESLNHEMEEHTNYVHELQKNISELTSTVAARDAQIAELEKRLADSQAACEARDETGSSEPPSGKPCATLTNHNESTSRGSSVSDHGDEAENMANVEQGEQGSTATNLQTKLDEAIVTICERDALIATQRKRLLELEEQLAAAKELQVQMEAKDGFDVHVPRELGTCCPHASWFAAKRVVPSLLLFATLLFGGNVFGFSSMQIILERAGFYAELCPPAMATCDDSQTALIRIYSIATSAGSLMSIPIGMLVDWSRLAGTAVAGALVAGGYVLVAVSSPGTDGLDVLTPAFGMIACGGVMTLLLAFPASFLLASSRSRIRAMAAANLLFDASAVLYVQVEKLTASSTAADGSGGWAGGSGKGIPARTVFAGLATVASVLYTSILVFWWSIERRQRGREALGEVQEGGCGGEKNTADRTGDMVESDGSAAGTEGVASGGRWRKLWRDIGSKEFLLLWVLQVVHQWRSTSYLGFAKEVLEGMGDVDHTYMSALMSCLPLGVVFYLPVTRLLRTSSLATSAHVTNVAGGVCALLALTGSLALQPLTFFVFIGFRALLYSFSAVYVARVFGKAAMGTTLGFVALWAGLACLLQYPVATAVTTRFEGDYTVYSAASTALCVPVGIVVCAVASRSSAVSQRGEGGRGGGRVTPAAIDASDAGVKESLLPHGEERSDGALGSETAV